MTAVEIALQHLKQKKQLSIFDLLLLKQLKPKKK